MTAFCPDEERLAIWMEQKLPVTEDQVVAKHLAACDACRRAVTLAYLSSQELPASIDWGREAKLLATVQSALAAPSSCPNEEQLAQWPDGDRAPIMEHLAGCDDCRRTLALTRLARDIAVSALSETQERKILDLVLRQTSRSIQFTFWRVAAAAFIVGTAVTYLSFEWNRPEPTQHVTSIPRDNDIPSLIIPHTFEKPSVAPRQAPETPKPAPPVREATPPRPTETAKPEPAPTTPPVAPEPEPKPTTTALPKPDLAEKFSAVAILEADGVPIPAPEVGFGHAIRVDKAGSINVAGRAIVALEAKTEIRLGHPIDGPCFALQVDHGCAYVDTARDEQAWEFWRAEQSVTVERINGRVSVEAAPDALNILVISGHAYAKDGRKLEAGERLSMAPDGSVSRDKADGELRSRKARYDALKPKSILLRRFRSDSPMKAARGSDNPSIPGLLDPVLWVGVTLPEPVDYSSGLRAVVRFRSPGTALVFAAEGFHRSVTRPASAEWATETWSFKGMQKDMVDLVAGEPLRKISIGVVQPQGRATTLDVDSIEIRRTID